MEPFQIKNVRTYPLKERKSLSRVEDVMRIPEDPPHIDAHSAGLISRTVDDLKRARENGSSRMLIYGAHLIKNGANPILIRLMEEGWLTHLATNGAGIIHDWEYAHHGLSTESVRDNVAEGKFGTWEETGRAINLTALMAGHLGIGFGEALGRLICHNGWDMPSPGILEEFVRTNPTSFFCAAKADLLHTMIAGNLDSGYMHIPHPWSATCVAGAAFRLGISMSVHPGIGYDIYTNHPLFHGGAIGRAAAVDFQKFSTAVQGLDKGVTLSVGSAIMGPQVFEKSLSCVNNQRIQKGLPIITDHSIIVVDLQDGGNWDWTRGEPPVDNPAYYLRFCKSYSRMGGSMHYICLDNIAFIYHLARELAVLP